MLSTYAMAAWIAGLLLVWRVSRIGRRPADYPPGPPTLPVLGNIHQIPVRDQHKQFHAWAKQYGPVYSLILGTKVMVVLSSDEAVKDLLDKRSAIYSDRLHMYIGGDISSGGLRLLMMHYGPKWRMIRKMIHQLLNINAAKAYVPYQDLENKQMMQDLLDQPLHFLEHIRRYSSSLTTSIVFGWRTATYDDPNLTRFFTEFEKFLEINQAAITALADFFPVLQRLPSFLFPTQVRAAKLHEAEKKLYVGHWLNCKAAVEAGTARPCFCVDMARHQRNEGFSDDQAGYISGTLYEAGSDTTSSTLYGFVQAMLLYPDTQRKAQAEIDRVVGPDRLPDMDDEPKMQYVRGCMKETLRWMPTALLGAVPHAVLQDDEYMGYTIPKGAGVLNNVWAIHRDPQRYPQPERFDPDRYKDDLLGLADSAAVSDVKKRDQFGFGAGRRICQGMHVAERSLFLAISRMLWGFDITPALDADGNPKLPEQDVFTAGFVTLPERYEATITPRSAQKAEIIRREWKEAKENLDAETGQWNKAPKGMAPSSFEKF